jgi:nucleoside-diphosphate-sugar epimerase
MTPIPALRHRPTRVPTAKTGKAYLVTGGHGMLGSHLVEALLARGEERVHVFDLAPSALFEDEARRGLVTFHRGDLGDRAAIDAACRGIDTVFHTAASVEQKLVAGAPVCGRAYFITNYPPSSGSESYLDFNTRFARHFGRTFRLAPAPLISALAWSVQAAVRASGGTIERRLGDLRKLRPSSVALARATFYFSHRRAAEDFGYEPIYTADEGMRLTVEHWKRAR